MNLQLLMIWIFKRGASIPTGTQDQPDSKNPEGQLIQIASSIVFFKVFLATIMNDRKDYSVPVDLCCLSRSRGTRDLEAETKLVRAQ